MGIAGGSYRIYPPLDSSVGDQDLVVQAGDTVETIP
jgi:hypothetical protein